MHYHTFTDSPPNSYRVKSNLKNRKTCIFCFIILSCWVIVLYEIYKYYPYTIYYGSMYNDNISLNYNKTVFLVRHYEKLNNKENGLDEIGLLHSKCLVSYFYDFEHGVPQVIYTELSRSFRSLEYVVPLSINLSIPVYIKEKKIISNIANWIVKNLEFYDVILVVLEPNGIVEVAQYLGCESCVSWNIDPLSRKENDENLYDITWQLIYTEFNSKLQSFYTIEQTFEHNICTKNNHIRRLTS